METKPAGKGNAWVCMACNAEGDDLALMKDCCRKHSMLVEKASIVRRLGRIVDCQAVTTRWSTPRVPAAKPAEPSPRS